MLAGTPGGPGIDYRIIEGMDPAANWLFGPGRNFFYPPGESNVLIPFTMSLQQSTLTDASGRLWLDWFDKREPAPGFIVLGPTGRERRLQPASVFAALAPQSFFDLLATSDKPEYAELRKARKLIKLGLPLAASTIADKRDQAPQVAARTWPAGTVVMAVIDDGIAFANTRFRRSDNTTRFESFWIQDQVRGGTAPSDFAYGRELIKAEIDDLIANSIDEDTIYRRAGLTDFTSPLHKAAAWRVAHGTHVLDLAAGFDHRRDDRADRPIIGVQLRVAATANQSGAGLEADVQAAVDFILSRAAALTEPGQDKLPVVINFSYGTHDGPHDGTSNLERALDQVIANAPPLVRVVLPAGNTHQSRCHAKVAFRRTGEQRAVELRLQPDGQHPTGLEMWLPSSLDGLPPTSRVTLTLASPGGDSHSITEALGQEFNFEVGGAVYCHGVYDYMPWPTARGVFRIDLNPTVMPVTGTPPAILAPSGIWKITLTNTALRQHEPVEAWISRDDLLYGYPRRGRQAYFDDRRYARFDAEGRALDDDPPANISDVQRAGMLNALGCGEYAIVAGGYDAKTLNVTTYSAGGPIPSARGGPPEANGKKPDALVVSDDSKVHAGIIATGTRSGSASALSGTSLAAPQLARQCAEWIAQGRTSGRNAVKDLAQSAEHGPPANKPPLPPQRSGWGRIPRAQQTRWRQRYWD